MPSASHIGREHVRLGRNNQDGHFATSSVVVVTDGCSSQPNSEVGAQLGARFLGEWLSAQISLDDGTAERAMNALCEWMKSSAVSLGGIDALEKYFLFTVLAAVRRGDRTLVFGMGDGGVLVDDRLVRLDSGPDNAPPYCAYRLTSSEPPPVEVHHFAAAGRVAVMTDGLNALDPLRLRALIREVDPARNPLTLQRRLNVLSETERFGDDATLAVLC
ncbi:MAG: protein phosphatase 2C domain-containing protein [Archangium sp.]